MALTRDQLISLGFRPSKKKTGFAKSYHTLIYRVNKTDYLYVNKNGSMVWMCFKDLEGQRINYQVINIGATGFSEMRDYIQRIVSNFQMKEAFLKLPHGQDPEDDATPLS